MTGKLTWEIGWIGKRVYLLYRQIQYILQFLITVYEMFQTHLLDWLVSWKWAGLVSFWPYIYSSWEVVQAFFLCTNSIQPKHISIVKLSIKMADDDSFMQQTGWPSRLTTHNRNKTLINIEIKRILSRHKRTGQ